jgi:hypothetical protein
VHGGYICWRDAECSVHGSNERFDMFWAAWSLCREKLGNRLLDIVHYGGKVQKRIGTIIHGALGDCYEQLLVLRLLKAQHPKWSFVGFFATLDRMTAMKHFELDMLSEVHGADRLVDVPVDEYFQMQVHDGELRELVLNRLPYSVRSRFDLATNHKPWTYLRRHDFRKSGLKLELSLKGRDHYRICLGINGIDVSLFGRKPTVGFLWRYRDPGGAISAFGQRDRRTLMAEMSRLFNRIIRQYDAHIFVCGMAREESTAVSEQLAAVRAAAGVLTGEVNAKYAKESLEIPEDRCTYLRGLGYAVEMEIMAQCDLLLLMPSGFSEPLWMRRDVPVMLVAPPPNYLLKLLWNRMPLFGCNQIRGLCYNAFVGNSPAGIWQCLVREKSVRVRQWVRET